MILNTQGIEKLKNEALKILAPIRTFDENTKAEQNFLFTAQKSDWSSKLPPFYLIYFLFAELLDFKNLGQFEKIAWSFPIDLNGKAFLVEYRKFGVGVFIQSKDDEDFAKIIVSKINGAVKKVQPYYSYVAEKAVNEAQLNVTNNNEDLETV